MYFYKQLTDIQLDALREIGNIGAGNAATTMSKLVNKKIDMQVPSVKIIAFDEVMEMIGGPEKLIVAIYIRVQGEAPGTVFFILTKEDAENLVRDITQDQEFALLSEEPPSEFAISTINEIGNILAGSYLTALSDFTNINMQPSVPSLGIDMAGAILTVGLLELSPSTDYAIIIDTKINEQSHQNRINANFLLLPDPPSLKKIFSSLGIDEYD